MSGWREIGARAIGVVTRGRAGRRRDSDLHDEGRFHVEMLEERYRRQGLDPATAYRQARADFGGVTQVTEAHRDQRTLPWVETLMQDARYGARMLVRTPGFTLAALLTLALGIGANTAIFSILNAVVLQPLPYADPDRLVVVGDRSDGLPGNMGFATFKDYRDRARTFDALVAIRSWTPTLVAGGEAERIAAMRVSWNYFDVLGVQPALGRGFRAEEDRPEQWRVLLISDGLWRRRFGADPSVINRTVRMNDRDYRIVGVLPENYEPLVSQHFYQRAEMWAPLGYDLTLNYACRGCQHLKALGRVRPGTTLAAAAADLNAIRAQLVTEWPTEYPRGEMAVMNLQDKLSGPIRGALLTLVGAVAFVLLIACANVANLLLARGMHRSREMAVRAALGAGRFRLLRQLLTESVMLGAIGGALGLGLAALSMESLSALAPVTIPRLDRVGIDGPVLAFAVVMSVLTGLVFGLIPAWKAAALDPQRALATESRGSIGAGSHRTRRLLVIADLALALVLLAGAGLMLKSVERLMRVDPGFDARQVLTLQFSLVGTAYAEDAVVSRFIDRVVERVRALPGVEAAAAAGQIPMGGNRDTWGFHVQGRIPVNFAENPSVERYAVTPDYFRVMRIPLRRGRLLADSDRVDSVPVMVVAESTARALFSGEDPIGQRVRIGDHLSGPWRTIVGIAGDVRHTGLDQPATMQMYLPQSQNTDSFLVLTVRSAADPASLTPAIRGVLRALDPAVPIYQVATLEDLVGGSVADRRFVMRLLAGFAALALLLAAIGLYGVVSYMVSQRTREVSVRVALGATPRDILRLILASGLVTVAVGLGVGLVAALIAVRFMERLLFDVKAGDPATMAAAAGALGIVALVAHWVPARRALRVDPAMALRQE